MLRFLIPLVFILSSAIAAPIPTLSASQPGVELIGEAFSQELCFKNSGDATGYQPQFEIVTPQGITMGSSFTYINNSFSIEKSFTCNSAHCDVSNDDTSVVTSIDENESFYVINYPLGSFPTAMQSQCMNVTFTLDTNSTVLPIAKPTDIKVTPLFSLGATAVDDGSSIYGSTEPLTVIPSVFTITKMIAATEGETAIGENFPHVVTLEINVANGQNVSNIVIEDTLPPEMHFKSLISSDACNVDNLPDFNTTQLLKFTCPLVVGTLAPVEKTITFDFYIPKIDADGIDVIEPNSGASNLILNKAKASAVYDGTSISDEDNATILAKVFTSHKTMQIVEDNGISGMSPDDIIEYTITMDISDYYSIKDLEIDDNLSDAQLYIPNTAKFVLRQDGGLNGGNFTDGVNLLFKGFDLNTGSANYQFYLSDANHNFPIDGDAIDGDYVQGATQAIIKFRAEVQEKHRASGSENEKKVKSGDVISNDNLSHAKFPDGTVLPDDSSNASDSVAIADGEKTIYAINGNTTVPNPVVIAAGETITYRIKMDFPIKSFSELNITDYLPAPLLDASTFAGIYDLSSSADAPLSGQWKRGPQNSYDVPAIVTKNVGQNKIIWSFKPQDTENNTSEATVIDLLFTLTVTDAPLADRLVLSNLANVEYENSQGHQFGGSDIATVITKEPMLEIQKKILSSSGGSGSSIEQTPTQTYNSLLHNGVGGETLNFEVNVTNSGSHRAYDINLTDIYTQNSQAQGLTSCTVPVITGGNSTSSTRSNNILTILADFLDENNSMLITYSCDIDGAYTPGKDIINTAKVINYANNPNGPNFVNKSLESKTKIDLKGVISLDKEIYNTSLAETDSNSSVNKGELIDFNMTLVLSPGTYKNYQFIDTKCPTLTDFSYTNTVVSGSDLVVSGGDGIVSFTCKNYIATTSDKNTITFRADNVEDISSWVSWNVVIPPVSTAKTMTPKKADAGDTIAGKFTWNVQYNSNPSNHPAYNCSVEDNLSSAHDFTGKVIYDFSSFAFTGVMPAGYSCAFDNVTGVISCHTDDNATVCPNGEVNFNITTNADAVVGSSYPNTIKFDGKTLPEGHYSGSDTKEGDVKKESTAAFALNDPAEPIKKIIATSESATDDSNLDGKPPVAIGEVITYEIEYAFPEGVTKNVILSDVLVSEKWGEYVPGSFYIRKSSTDINGTSAVAQNLINPATVNTNISIPDSDLIFNGRKISLELENVQNSNVTAGTSTETYTIGMRYRMKNIASNTTGKDKYNRGVLTFTKGDNTVKNRDSEDKQVRIVEPMLELLKRTTNGITFEAGDTVNYELSICNGHSLGSNDVATAFDMNISDVLPDKLSGSNVVVTPPIGTHADAFFSDSQHLIGVIDKLEAGACVTITYDTFISFDAKYGEELSNTLSVEATSLTGVLGEGGDVGLSHQNPGDENGERTGSGGVNYLHQQSHFTIYIGEAGITKMILNHQNYYAIEDNATYRILISAPKGSVTNFEVHDQLPKGLALVGTPTVDSNIGSLSPSFLQSGGLLVWDFGDFTATDKVIVSIEYNVTIENILSNQDGSVLQNSALLQYDDPNSGGHIINGPISSQKEVRVGEPNLLMQKLLLSAISDVQAGDKLSYRIRLKNQGHTEAYDLNWSDVLPKSLAQISNQRLYLLGSPARRHDNNAVITSGDLTKFLTYYGDGALSNDNSLQLPPLNLPVGGEIVIDFDAKVQSNLVAGSKLTNNTQADYKSMFDFGRDGSTCGDDDDDSVLNNYCEKASASFTANAEVRLSKTLQLQKDEYAIGEHVIYKLRISIPQATLLQASLIDKLPLGLTYVSHTIAVGNGGIGYDSGALNPVTCTSGDVCEVAINFDEITNPDNGNRHDDYIDVLITARVENVLANQNKTLLINGSSGDGVSGAPVYFEYSEGRIYYDSNPLEAGYQGVAIEVVEPYLKVEKTVTPSLQTINDIITYHVKVYHTSLSQSDAYDLNFTDTLPVGIDYISGSETNIKLSQNGRTLYANADMFPRNKGVYEFSYKAKIKASVDPKKTYYNDIELKYASISGATGAIDGGRNGQDGSAWNDLNNYVAKARVGVMASESSSIKVTKSVDRHFVTTSAGDGDVLYTLNIDNNGTLDVNLTSIIDDKFGDLTAYSGSTCSLPQKVYVAQTYSCTFPATITGTPGSLHINTVTVHAQDRAGNSDSDSDKAEVYILDGTDSAIGKIVFEDLNNNGILDSNEKGIDGVSLELIESGSVVATTVTAHEGYYLFDGLNAGTYTVRVSDIAGVLTGYSLTTANYNYTTTLGASSQDFDANFGYIKPQISVVKSSDVSAVNAGAVGGDVTYTVEITNTGASEVKIISIDDSKFDVFASPSDCKIDKYLLANQSYTCQFTRHFSGYSVGDTHTNRVSVQAQDSDGNLATASDTQSIVFTDGTNGWAGLLIYYDANGNGAYDAGESGLDNVKIVLADKDENIIDTTTSSQYISQVDSSGLYLFGGLPAGDYIIYTDGGKPTWRAITPKNPDGGYVYTGGASAQIPFTMSAGQIYLQANFGFARSDINVSKYADKTSLTPPGGDVTYTVVVKNSGGVDVNLTSLIDDKFGDLDGVGSCSVLQSISVGGSYSCSFTKTITGSEGDVHTNTVTATAHDRNGNDRNDTASRDVAFSFTPITSKSIGDMVYWDKNNNGIFDGSDEGFDNVTVELHDGADNVIATYVTSNGHYIFDNLNDDTYSVVITDVNDVLQDFSLTAGSNPHTNILIDINHQIHFDIDFGYRKTVQVPLFDTNSRIILLLLFLISGTYLLYARERVNNL